METCGVLDEGMAYLGRPLMQSGKTLGEGDNLDQTLEERHMSWTGFGVKM